MRRIARVIVLGCLGLAGCAEVPPAAPGARPYGESIEHRRQLAKSLRASGDLAAAAAQWQVLTILEPDDVFFREQLAATRAALAQAVKTNYERGLQALEDNDSEEAARLMLKVLALDPGHEPAAQALRGIEANRIARVQVARATRARRDEEQAKNHQDVATNGVAEYRRAYDLEQTIEMFTAGDAQGGLRELQRYIGANPGDKAGRRRIADVVFEQGQKLDTATTRERAVTMYEQAIKFRDEAVPAWNVRLAASRKALANDHYEYGMRAYRGDLDRAIRHWEACLRFDPQHANCSLRLKEAKSFQSQLERIGKERPKR